MQNLKSLWAQLDLRRRLLVIGVTVAMFAAVIGISRLANAPDYALLYAGLDSAVAGEVIAALDQRGIAYEVRGDSIHVDAPQRDAVRMALASEGLPAAGAGGYELLDGLSGFGTTSQMFDAAYWRAKEGELARTILATPGIKSARVHIAQTTAQPFRQKQRATASVTVAATGGLTPLRAKALKHLVAGAVTGMQPADVSVIDTVTGLVSTGEEEGLQDPAGADRAAELRANIQRLLEARVGPGNAVVEVSLDLVTEREQITERIFDPQGRVAISTDTEEKSGTSREGSEDVTVASNLPEGDATAGGKSQSQTAETRERVNFEVSETQREVIRAPGSIRKISVAVLVDGIQKPGPDGTLGWEARPEEELAVLRELVSSAVGFDAARGDVLTLKSLAFEPLPDVGTLAEAGMFSALGNINIMALIQLAVLTLVALVLGLFVLRPILAGTGGNAAPLLPPVPLALPGTGSAALEARSGEDGFRVVSGEIDDIGDLSDIALVSAEASHPADDPMARLRKLIEERQAESVEILRSWLEADEERA
ncbi:flagellar M-ring protein FliF [Gemmobacter fulvus]|uniref:Flagellar M-ring protein n=1 Tax=Gemmobacter fulvus TaxID=2840474 RepID=A0A975P3K1_9RHOB|nr:flagellar basal-body MS-ring/collar protein FliF [Gemmobacter fulvus]MBT9246887.1 flagellar M-ring protein FliF [Gemmobacter fulvus]QWK89024.1 flagellar M-ring protein FliF [Gemmobacter fulvus]